MNDPVLSVALQGMQHDMARLERVGMNLSNAQTTGYKREVPGAPAAFVQLLATGAGGATRAAAIHIDQRPGTLRATGQRLDLALAGPGWFELQTAEGVAYTRQGSFRLDARGRLVTAQGLAVMGVAGEIQLPHGMPMIDEQGRVFEGALPTGAPASTAARAVAQLKVVRFDPQAAVQRLGHGLVAVQGEPLAGGDSPTEVRQGYLENSNVSSMEEMVLLLQTLRHFETLQKVVIGYDEMLGSAIRRLGETS